MARSRQAKTTLSQIARKVGCSRPVVSKVVNGAKGRMGVSIELRERIETVAREMGYYQNYHAISLRTGIAGIVGIICGPGVGFYTGFAAPLIEGLDSAVRAGGSDLMVIGSSKDETELERGLRLVREGKIDALCLPAYIYNINADDERFADLPVVTILGEELCLSTHVDVDLAPGIEELIQHLISLGHQEVMWVGFEGRLDKRRELTRSIAEKDGVAFQSLVFSKRRLDESNPDQLDAILRMNAGHFREWLDSNEPPRVIIGDDEKMAISVCRELHRAGYSIPQDTAVVGFDNVRANLCDPPLTVVSQSLEAMGREAAGIAFEMRDNPENLEVLKCSKRRVPAKLFIRDSTKG